MAGGEIRAYFRLLPEEKDDLVRVSDYEIHLNLLTFLCEPPNMYGRVARSLVEKAKGVIAPSNGAIVFVRSLEYVGQDFETFKLYGHLSFDEIAMLRIAIAEIFVACRAETHSDHSISLHSSFGQCTAKSTLRFGIVELRVLENYLLHREATAEAIQEICFHIDDEEWMYRPGKTSSFLNADDVQWALRRLMTNAGFYVSRDPEVAIRDLSNWCDRYILAMKDSRLVSVANGYPFAFSIQKFIYTEYLSCLNYCSPPTPAQVYQKLSGKKVLLVSPLAELVERQFSTGRIFKLFCDWEVPEYEITCLEAPVSTWPNRPDESWGVSFEKMCLEVRGCVQASGFDLFVASCGCYGMPLCEYVMKNLGVESLYIGNMIHAYFGIRQSATEGFMAGRRYEANWIKNDLKKFRNLHLIDAGRYV